jgi:uncharacterized membrane protein required for colicin V production
MTDFFSGNLFDLAIYVCLFVAVVMGFMTGLLRGLATIFGYVCGMGVAVVAAPKLTSLLASFMKSAPPPTWIVLIATFVVTGAVISALLRLAVGEMVGPNVSIPDRIAGGLLEHVASCCSPCSWFLCLTARFRPVANLLSSRSHNGGRFCHRRRNMACNRSRLRSRITSIV